MIDSVIAFLTLFLIHRTKKQYNEALYMLNKLAKTQTLDVAEVVRRLKENPGKSFDVIVKGVVKAKQALDGEKNILSIIDSKDLRNEVTIANMFEKLRWDDILSKAYYRRPWNLNNVIFDLKDFTSNEMI